MSDSQHKTSQAVYSIPAKYRRMENLHIVFWIIKDLSWCMGWVFMGIGMIIPTLFVAIFISWRTRHITSELAHNLAVAFWICANSTWMIMEFIKQDHAIFFDMLTGKQLSLIPFTIGSLILLYYYLIQAPKERKKRSTAHS
jgi:prepilin signal peptidase PulO-like enzyme (type II secretory pathway)